MAVKFLNGAVLAAALLGASAQAQSISQIGGPANAPPNGFTGQQFVDSRGCLFLKAGYGGSVNWVARVDRSRKPICGMVPTGSAAAAAAVAADMATSADLAPQVATTQATAATAQQPVVTAQAPQQASTGFDLASLFGIAPARPLAAQQQPVVQVAAPVVQSQPAPTVPRYQSSGVATSVAGVTCYADAPVLEQVRLTNGSALVCTKGDGSASGWRPPMVAAGTQVAARSVPAVQAPVVVTAPVRQQPIVQVAAPVVMQPAPVVRQTTLPKPPKGWAYAWKDGRLNPMRGVGTAEGQAQQDRVWQRTIPMVEQPAPVVLRTSASTMSAPQGSGGVLVQVGSFAHPANAQGVVTRLQALGLPVSTAHVTRKGKALQIVYAGPFSSSAEAGSGLAIVRGAGFADAILR